MNPIERRILVHVVIHRSFNKLQLIGMEDIVYYRVENRVFTQVYFTLA